MHIHVQCTQHNKGIIAKESFSALNNNVNKEDVDGVPLVLKEPVEREIIFGFFDRSSDLETTGNILLCRKEQVYNVYPKDSFRSHVRKELQTAELLLAARANSNSHAVRDLLLVLFVLFKSLNAYLLTMCHSILNKMKSSNKQENLTDGDYESTIYLNNDIKSYHSKAVDIVNIATQKPVNFIP